MVNLKGNVCLKGKFKRYKVNQVLLEEIAAFVEILLLAVSKHVLKRS